MTRAYVRTTPLEMFERPIVERLGNKFVFAPNGCWLWTAGTNVWGYGKFSLNDQRLICLVRGHVVGEATATIPGVTFISQCSRCRRFLERAAVVKTRTRLRLVKPKDAA